jgi:hypothetical protein
MMFFLFFSSPCNSACGDSSISTDRSLQKSCFLAANAEDTHRLRTAFITMNQGFTFSQAAIKSWVWNRRMQSDSRLLPRSDAEEKKENNGKTFPKTSHGGGVDLGQG